MPRPKNPIKTIPDQMTKNMTKQKFFIKSFFFKTIKIKS